MRGPAPGRTSAEGPHAAVLEDGAAVTFDLWHTLVYLEPADEETYMDRQAGIAVGLLSRSERQTGARPRTLQELRHAWDLERSTAVAAADRGRTIPVGVQFERAARRAGRVGHAAEYLAALKVVIGRTRFRRAPYALVAVRRLHDAGFRVGLVSNTVGEPGAFLRPLLERMGLDRYLSAVVFSDEHSWTKPSPAIFRELLDQLGARADRSIHVGDGWSDVEGARRAGMRGTILYTGLQRYSPSYRRLFARPARASPSLTRRVSRLDRVPRIARELLDGSGAGPDPREGSDRDGDVAQEPRRRRLSSV